MEFLRKGGSMKVSQNSAFLVLSFFTISSLALAQSTYDDSTAQERIVASGVSNVVNEIEIVPEAKQ